MKRGDRTLARPYAKALFSLAKEDASFVAWSDFLAFASFVMSEKKEHSSLKRKEAQEAMRALLEEGATWASMSHFLRLLIQYKRLDLLPAIQERYEALRRQEENSLVVQVVSAYPLSESYQERLKQALQKKWQKHIALVCSVDKHLLGGARIQVGDRVIDDSIRAKFHQLEQAMGTVSLF